MMKVGDRVKAISEVGRDKEIGVSGIIIHKDGDEGRCYLVEFDTDIGGHDGNDCFTGPKGIDGRCWWCNENEIKLTHPQNAVNVSVEGRTVRVSTSDGRFGEAECHPDDKFDVLEGLKIAIEHAQKLKTFTEVEKETLKYLKFVGCNQVSVFNYSDHTKIYGVLPIDESDVVLRLPCGDFFESLVQDHVYYIDDLLNRE